MRDAIVVVAFVALALSALVGPEPRVDLTQMLAAPSAAHLLGTDNLGRDLLARLGAAVTGAILPLWAAVTAASAVGLAAAVGMIQARARAGAVAGAGLRAVDLAAALVAGVPVGLVAFAWAAWSGRAGLAPVLLSLAALFAVRSYLQARDLYRQDKLLGYWAAHEALGGGLLARVWRYGLCAHWRQRLAQALGFHLRAAVAIEASLSYLGFGVQEPQASLGNMLASHLDLHLKGQWTILAGILVALALAAAFPGSLLACLQALARRDMMRSHPRQIAPGLTACSRSNDASCE